jgi:hypothetical protein
MKENSLSMEQGTTATRKAIGCLEAFRRDPRHGIARCEVDSWRSRIAVLAPAGVNLKDRKLGLLLAIGRTKPLKARDGPYDISQR